MAAEIPTCIAVESGQADLFLSAYLGIDFETEGAGRLPVARRGGHFLPRLAGAGPGHPVRHRHRRLLPPGGFAALPVPVRGDGRRRTPDDHARRLRGVLHRGRPRRGPGDRQDRARPLSPDRPGKRPRTGRPRSRWPANRWTTPGSRPSAGATWPGPSARASRGSPLVNEPIRLPGGLMRLVDRVLSDRARGRAVRARPDPRRGRHPARRLVHDLPLRRRPGHAGHAHVRVLPAHPADLADADGLGWRGGAGRLPAGPRGRQQAQVPGAGDRVDVGRSRTKSRSRSWATAPSPSRSSTH